MEWTRDEFADAVTRHSRRMYRAARSVLDSGADAEDAVSQAVLQAWQSLDRLRDREAVRPWLVKIAVNCAYAQRRKQRGALSLDELPQEPAAPEPRAHDGLWEAVCALLSEALPTPVRRIGVNDEFGRSGPAEELLREFGLCADHIADTVQAFVEN